MRWLFICSICLLQLSNYSIVRFRSFGYFTLYLSSSSFFADGFNSIFHFTSPVSVFRSAPDKFSALTSISVVVDTGIWSSITKLMGWLLLFLTLIFQARVSSFFEPKNFFVLKSFTLSRLTRMFLSRPRDMLKVSET